MLLSKLPELKYIYICSVVLKTPENLLNKLGCELCILTLEFLEIWRLGAKMDHD